MKRIWLLALGLLFAAPALGDESGPMAMVANGFYGVYRAAHAPGGIPNDALMEKYHPYLSPALEALLRQAGAAQAKFSAANKGFPLLIEGDLFSSLFEGATGVTVTGCTGGADKGQCRIDLVSTDTKNKPVRWTDTLYLVRTPLGWRIDDIGYGGDLPSGNRGRLSETLHQVLSFQ